MAYSGSKVAGGKGNFSLNQNFEVEGVDVTLLTVDFIVDMSAETLQNCHTTTQSVH